VFALLLIPASASAATSEDANDAAGPLDLANLRLTQEERSVELRLRVHSSLPSLGELTAFPSRVEADNDRYLCLQLKGRATDHRLLCPAGERTKRTVTLGLSSYGEAGAATRRRTIAARLKRLREHSMTLSFPLRKAGLTKGPFAWRGLSGWTGEDCERSNRPLLARRDERRGVPIIDPPEKPENLCLDRAPDARFVKARFHPVRRVGCTRDEDLANTHGSRQAKKVALTFDDGPSTYTDSVLRILDRHKAKGSFYVLGDQAPGNTKTLRRAVRRGHELANHSMHHERYPSRSSMKATSARIEAATGFSPCTFRPPYGLMNGDVASAARANGMSSILWDVDTMDWTLPGSGAIYQRAVNDARPGSIVLMHDGGGPRGQTISALPRIIEALQSRGFELVTVTEILGEKFIWKEMHR
jgi:peptidoglycan/xylan/chitin deacetylase (PgdA/CDA1 family)